MIYMGGNVPLTITIIDAFSPYSNHSASGGTLCFSSHYYLWQFGLQSGLCPALPAQQPNRTRTSRAAAPGASDAPCMPQWVPISGNDMKKLQTESADWITYRSAYPPVATLDG